MSKNILAIVISVLFVGLAVSYVNDFEEDKPRPGEEVEESREVDEVEEVEEDEINEEEDKLAVAENNEENEDEPVESEEGNMEEFEEEDQGMSQFITCLAENDLVIYGLETCPACGQLADSFGGYEKIKPIYVECSEEVDRCRDETKTSYVPEIQIQGELYRGSRDLASIGEEAGCQL